MRLIGKIVIQDRAAFIGPLNDLPELYNNPLTKHQENVLQTISEQIRNSDLIKKGRFREDNIYQLNGFLTEFITTDSLRYVLACLKGGEVSNDHYPYYEFLFSDTAGQNCLLKEQRIYTDLAGIEGVEFATVFPLFRFIGNLWINNNWIC